MIIIDTNVVSALMMDAPDRKVVEWLDRAPAGSVWTTAITVFEIFLGLELLGSSRRRRSLETAFKGFIDEDLNGRVLHFDTVSALSAASISAGLRTRGQPVEARDVQIMGIAAARRAAVATRNVRHFVDSGLPVIDPWAALQGLEAAAGRDGKHPRKGIASRHGAFARTASPPCTNSPPPR